MNRRMVVAQTNERAQQARARNGVIALLVIGPTVVMFEQKLECFRRLTESDQTRGNV